MEGFTYSKPKGQEGLIPKLDINFPESLSEHVRSFYVGLGDKGLLKESVIDEKVEGEKSFYKKVIHSINQAIDNCEGKNIIILFDLDDSIISKVRLKDGSHETIIRPSATFLMDLLKKQGIEIGFLTSRINLNDQLEKELNPFKQFVSGSFLFSTRNVRVDAQERDALEKRFESMGKFPLIDDLLKTKFLDAEKDKPENSDKVFIPVDDLIYPLLFKYGIALEHSKEAFFI